MKWAPALFGLLALVLWEVAVRVTGMPVYQLPGPIAIIGAFLADPVGLLGSLVSTLAVTFAALLVAAVLGGAMAVAMSASRLAQAAIQPWAVALQVTPLPAIAPLVIIWVGDPFVALVVCATIVAFFPLFANTAAGLAS
ncbi:MAG TPA: ABC transporter permease, partial [Rhodopila sp.]|nr:ABC transporter permease [Rhodopila sp.]